MRKYFHKFGILLAILSAVRFATAGKTIGLYLSLISLASDSATGFRHFDKFSMYPGRRLAVEFSSMGKRQQRQYYREY